MNTDSFIVYLKTVDLYKEIQTRFDTSNYELDRPLPKGKSEITPQSFAQYLETGVS